MRKLLFTSLSLSFVFCGATIVSAQKEKPPKKSATETKFEKLDANSDGQLSSEEFCVVGKDNKPAEGKAKEAMEKKFKTYDADGSGTVSLEEYKLAGKKPKPSK